MDFGGIVTPHAARLSIASGRSNAREGFIIISAKRNSISEECQLNGNQSNGIVRNRRPFISFFEYI